VVPQAQGALLHHRLQLQGAHATRARTPAPLADCRLPAPARTPAPLADCRLPAPARRRTSARSTSLWRCSITRTRAVAFTKACAAPTCAACAPARTRCLAARPGRRAGRAGPHPPVLQLAVFVRKSAFIAPWERRRRAFAALRSPRHRPSAERAVCSERSHTDPAVRHGWPRHGCGAVPRLLAGGRLPARRRYRPHSKRSSRAD
jgi:hypothetical protein